MADVNKSIEIQYKADLSQLLANLKKMPNMTEKEAKKMVSELNKQLRRAEKEAKKTAQAMKASMQQSASSMSDFASQAGDTAEGMESVAETAGDLDRGFASVGMALGSVNPALGESAMLLADVGAVTEGVLLSVKALSTTVKIAAGVVGGLVIAYAAVSAAMQRNKDIIIEQREAQKALKDEQKAWADGLHEVTRTAQDSTKDFELLTGQITEYEHAIYSATRANEDQFKAQIDTQKNKIAEIQDTLALIEKMKKGQAVLSEQDEARLKTIQRTTEGVRQNVNLAQSGKVANRELERIERRLGKDLILQQRTLGGINAYKAQILGQTLQTLEYEKEMNEELEKQQEEAERQAKKAAGAAKWSADKNAMQSTLNQLLMDSLDTHDKIDKKFDEQAEALIKGEKRFKKYLDFAGALDEVERQRAEAHREAILANEEDELKLFKLRQDIAKEVAEANKAIAEGNKKHELEQLKLVLSAANIEAMSDQELHALRMEMMEKEGAEYVKMTALITKEIDRRAKATKDAIDMSVQGAIQVLGSLGQLAGQQAEQNQVMMDRQLNNLSEIEAARIEAVNNAIDAGLLSEAEGAKEQVKIEKELQAERGKIQREYQAEIYKAKAAEFRLNQAEASANVIMSTAVAVAKALELGPIAGPIAAGVMTASGLAQLGIIANQQPPVPTFDTGGMIGNNDPLRTDDVMIRARAGEAILDRGTVSRLGGEQGIRHLQQGGMTGSEVIVVSPFRHFGRFEKARQRAGGSALRRSGQRGY
jgi:hypothetical protein